MYIYYIYVHKWLCKNIKKRWPSQSDRLVRQECLAQEDLGHENQGGDRLGRVTSVGSDGRQVCRRGQCDEGAREQRVLESAQPEVGGRQEGAEVRLQVADIVWPF